MYISNDINVILKYFHFALLVVFIKYSRQAAYSQSMGLAINISHAQ
jgi:hypothetical protein